MRLIFIITLLSSSLLLSAQDKKAKKILDKLSESYTSSKSIEVIFDLIILYPDEEPTTYSSSVIQKGKKFVFRNSEHEYYGNGEDIWIYIPSKNEVQINDFEEDEAEDYFITPLDLLNQYKSGKYEYSIAEERKNDLDLEFKPFDEFADYSKFRITVLSKTNEITSIVAFGKDGSRLTLNITNVLKDKIYDDKIFKFDKSKNPGVRIEDLRLD